MNEEIFQSEGIFQDSREIFHEYEIKGWKYSDWLYKGIIASVLIHVLSIALISQVDLFGSKACDSPYIGKVCQVLDTVYVATKFLGTDTEFSSREYEKTELTEDLEVTFVDVTDRFTYPPGYFALAREMSEQNSFSVTENNQIPGIPLDITQPQTLPTPNPNPVIGDLPKPPSLNDTSPKPKRPRNRPLPDFSKRTENKTPDALANIDEKKIPTLNPTQNDINVASNANPNVNANQSVSQNANQNTNVNADQTAQEKKLEEEKLFNKKPLEDFGIKYGTAILNKELDLNAPFEIEIKANLNEFGKLIDATYSAKPESDAKMVEVAKEAISAFSDSQLLRTLYDVGIRSVKITFSQNKEHLQAVITSDAGTPNRASSIRSSVSLIIRGALSNMNPESDEAKLISRAEITSQGNLFVVNFKIPHNEKMELIEKNLRSLQEKQKKPNSDLSGKRLESREG
ncbi:MAG: hypothetical protein D6687_09220 [Acidobacteria bacterium]|jgi:hypothetical protein|nr:MAG: hypothetical protein D6687_09220 [Acidobacteriota bacterium]GIU82317.1 MAG: hypothetical protein KatS3mg006_1381 [Pyrinomonadaceae bacterium]